MAPYTPARSRSFNAQSIYMADGGPQIGARNYANNYGAQSYSRNPTNQYANNTGRYGHNYNSWTAPNTYGQPYNYVNTQPGYNYYQNYPGYNQQANNGLPANQHQNTYYGQQYAAAPGNNSSQQGYYSTSQSTYPSMDYSQWQNSQYTNSQYNYQYPPGYAHPQQQQYQQTPPQIRNPFAPPPAIQSQFSTQNAQHDPEYEAEVARWQATYAQPDPYEKGKKGGKTGKGENPNFTNIGVRQGPVQNSATENSSEANAKGTAADEKKQTVVRKGGGESWEDDTLLEWDPNQFRIMVGNLAGEVTDDSLFKAFAAYGPSKARVVRDKRTTKSKGFGFVAFTDGDLGFKAAREMTGKYIGSHPVTIQRSKTDVRPVAKKDKGGKNNKNKNKGKDGGKKNGDDALRANTGAHIEKKPVRNPAGYKILG